MKYFQYTVQDYEILGSGKETVDVPADFIKYKINMEGLNVYYRLSAGKLTEVIGEAIHEEAAHRRVNEFLSGFNVSLV